MTSELEKLISTKKANLRTIKLGGHSKEQLISKLISNDIQMNDFANKLFGSDLFETSKVESIAEVLEISINDLNFPNGAVFEEIFERAGEIGLRPCPLEIGPYYRLSYLDQREEVEIGKNKAPKGSITIFSKPLVENDDDFPKGFYIRKMDGKLWLRGYICPMDYMWESDAKIALMK